MHLMNFRSWWWLALLVALFALLLTPIRAQAESRGKPVVIADASMRMLAPVNWYTGTIISREQARLAAEVSGRLLWVAEVGTQVAQGDVVARIDNTLLREGLAERQADVERVKAQLGFLKEESSRLQRLAKQNNAAQSQLEKVLSEQASARSELAAAQARARYTTEQLERTELQAPFPGVVTERLLQAGEWADEGRAVVSMTDPDRLEVQSWVSVSALPFIPATGSLKIQVRDREYEGEVRTLVPVSDLRSRLYELRVSLPAEERNVGESVRIAVPTAKPKQVLAVPRDALVLRRDSIALFRINKENLAERIEVSTGIASGPYIEVGGKLQAGDRVVIRGGERLRDGQAVEIQELEAVP